MFVTVIHEKTETDIANADISNPTCLIMGDEGQGVSKEIADYADAEFKIPMIGGVSSLNVSVASGVVFYEWFKRK